MKKRGKNTQWKKALWIAAGCLAALFLVKTGTEAWLGDRVRKAVEKEIARRSDGMCRAEVGAVRINLLGRSVRLDDLTVRADTGLLRKKESALRNLSFHVARLSIGGIHWKTKDSVRLLSVADLELVSPRIFIERGTPPPIDTAARKPEPSWRERLSGLNVQATVGRFGIRDGSVELCEFHDGKSRCHRLDGLAVSTDHFSLDSSADSSARMWACDDMQLVVDRLNYRLDEGAVLLEIDTVRLGMESGTLAVAAVRLLPQYPKNEFAQQVPGHIDWTQANIRGIECSGIDYSALIEGRALRIDSVRIGNAAVESYKNRQIPRHPRVKKLFYESLQRLPLAVDVRRISLGNAYARYDELAENGTMPGTVRFDSLSGEFYGLTNRGDSQRPFFRLEAQGMLQGVGRLTASFHFPSDSSNRRFEIDGKLGPMGMPALNSVVTPLTGIRIDSGRIARIDFHVRGNDRRSTVEMVMLYSGLNVEILKRQENGRLKERRLLTFVVDRMLIRPDNPDSRGTRTGTGGMERNFDRSQFNYWWKSLLPGIKSTVLGRKAEKL